MSGQFVGFYWTLPINWANFRYLPRNVEAAAAKSRTIRYQMHVVRRWVADNGGHLIKEIVFLELSPDRGTEAVRGELEAVRKLCLPNKAELIHVDFAEAFHWRRHPHLNAFIEEHAIPRIGLPPDPITMNGRRFDPIRHFEESRAKHSRKTASFREMATAELLAAAARHGGGPGDYRAISEDLNRREVKTPTGRT